MLPQPRDEIALGYHPPSRWTYSGQNMTMAGPASMTDSELHPPIAVAVAVVRKPSPSAVTVVRIRNKILVVEVSPQH
jgi:hypothetical protein